MMNILFDNFNVNTIWLIMFIILIIFLFLCFYKRYVIKNSQVLTKIDELNSKYYFNIIPNLNMKHSYDNENIYDEITPKDYLIYELQFKKKDFKQAIKDVKENLKNYNNYIGEFNLICDAGNDMSTIKLKFLFNLFEKHLINKKKQKPVIELNVYVILILTNINGERKTWKSTSFNSKEIYDFIYCLEKKNGSFYLVPEIWQSICRVERGKVTNKMRFTIYNRDNYRCRRCGRATDDLEIDHIYPISKGGKSTMDNLQTLCHSCNVKKGSSTD